MNPKIMVIEDDIQLQHVLGRALKKLLPECDIRWATTSDEAWETIRLEMAVNQNRIAFDLIISDIQLPGQEDGIELWKRLKRRDPNIPFLFISGIEVQQFIKRCANVLTDSPPLISKPINLRSLMSMVSDLMQVSA